MTPADAQPPDDPRMLALPCDLCTTGTRNGEMYSIYNGGYICVSCRDAVLHAMPVKVINGWAMRYKRTASKGQP